MDNTTLIQNEQSVIGSLLINNDSFDEIESLNPSDFLREDHQIIFRCIADLIENGKPVDLILLAEELERKGDLERVGGLPYIGTVVQNTNTSKNIKSRSESVRSASKLRQLKSFLVDVNDSIERKEPVDVISEKTESGLFSLLDNQEGSGMSHISEVISEAVDWADSDESGLKTGLIDLDRMIGGLNKSNLIILAGRPSMGKSSLAFQIAEHIAKHHHVLAFSLEMSKREVGTRMLNFHEKTVGRSEAVKHLFGLKMHVFDKPAVTVSYIRSHCRKIKRKHGLSMILIDYLQLMSGKGDNRTQEVGGISRGLKGLAKEFDVPVVVLSQLNRTLENRSDKRPVMSDLRESGEIEQDADLILFIYRDEVYDKSSDFRGHAEIICRKNRNGAIGDILTTFSGELTRFGNTTKRIERTEKKTSSKGFDSYS